MLINQHQLVSESAFLFIQITLLVTSKMVFSYEEKVIIKYLWIKDRDGATTIINDHPEYEWKVNDVKKLLKKNDETGYVARKEVYGRTKSLRTKKKIKLVQEMILSQEDQQELILHQQKLHVNLIVILGQCPVQLIKTLIFIP